MQPQERTMRVKFCSMAQQAALVCAVMTVFVLVFHNLAQETADPKAAAAGPRLSPVQGWPERAPRSLGRDYELPGGENTLQDGQGEGQTGARAEDPLDGGDDEEERRKGLLNALVATATAKPTTSLDDIFISVKTTKKFHKERLEILLRTWFKLAPRQTWFFTDDDDAEYQRKTGGHLVNTNCSASHRRTALCCKMAREFDAFLESNKRWWCHFDDDNYVNVPQLVRTLGDYDPTQDWYLGKNSIRAPLEIINRDNVSQRISFWFATGGAGFCISRSLGLKMMPVAGGGKFVSVGDKIRLPDDVTIGYVVEHVLRRKLTVLDEFHSHLESMKLLNTDNLASQISFSYSKHPRGKMNALPIDGLDAYQDPTRFLSIHCRLFGDAPYCPK
ncbi:fringe glycosyltransferase isoform X1 [Penaeus vannamei]|uniref:fringe glycosyltransferase isoform X1 n=3 Tax=Penaeus TaxID=133894 RepID=UPI000F67A28A|nr:fringe glycosyltransferase-like [Penaeus vannamei]